MSSETKHQARSSSHSPTTDPETQPQILDSTIVYPEGGLDAWLVVLGAWSGLTASLGLYNTTGVFSVVISKVLLPDDSSSTLGWIFSVYAFVTWLCGVQIGPTFDAMGPRVLILAGSVCTLVGMLALSFCTGEYPHLSCA
jgi:MFS family permease